LIEKEQFINIFSLGYHIETGLIHYDRDGVIFKNSSIVEHLIRIDFLSIKDKQNIFSYYINKKHPNLNMIKLLFEHNFNIINDTITEEIININHLIILRCPDD